MEMHSITGYKDIFGDPRPSISELLKDVRSAGIIAYFAAINNLLILKGDEEDSQLRILRTFGQNFPQEDRDYIFQRLVDIKAKKGTFTLFSPQYVVAFLSRELLNYREFVQTEVSEMEEINAFKAYLAYIDEIEEESLKNNTKIVAEAQEAGNQSLRNVIWPYVIKQFEFMISPDVIFEMVKGMAFFKFLQEDQFYADYLNAFLAQIEVDDPLMYVSHLFHLIKQNQDLSVGSELMQFSLRFTIPPSSPVFKDLILDVDGLKENSKKIKDYVFLKERPLVRFKEDEYIVTHLPYLYLNLYRGLVFAFYHNSGLANKIKRFDQYLGDIGKRFMEEVFFCKIIKCCFEKKYNVSVCPDESQDINPDFYYRDGNAVYIFEFKEALLNKDIIHSNSYDEIKQGIEDKLATKGASSGARGKGLYQLTSIMRLLEDEKELFGFDSKAKQQGVKLKNLVVYPIIVHTNSYFDMPGVNNHLNDLLDIELTNSAFKAIKPLTVINLQYFFQNLQLFKDGKVKLRDELDAYQQEIIRRGKKADRTGKVDDIGNTMPSFYEYNLGRRKSMDSYKKSKFIQAVFDCLSINLPDSPESSTPAEV